MSIEGRQKDVLAILRLPARTRKGGVSRIVLDSWYCSSRSTLLLEVTRLSPRTSSLSFRQGPLMGVEGWKKFANAFRELPILFLRLQVASQSDFDFIVSLHLFHYRNSCSSISSTGFRATLHPQSNPAQVHLNHNSSHI